MNRIDLTSAYLLFRDFAGCLNIAEEAALKDYNSFDEDLKKFVSYEEILEGYVSLFNMLPQAVQDKLK